MSQQEVSYFQHRMQLLGITEEENKVDIYQNESGTNVLKPIPVFRQNLNRDGTEYGIDILVYSLDRTIINYKPENSRWSKSYCLTRLRQPIERKDGSLQKYYIPKGQGTYPFFHPRLIDKFDKSESIDTLFLIEGFFKAWKGAMHGMDIVGLSSITHMRDKEKGTLHKDILRIIKACKVKKIVWLTDGDCLDITKKELEDGIDLYKRPKNFFASCETFKQLLDDFDGDKYFMHINSDDICSNYKEVQRDQVKGLDDLLCTFPDRIEEIIRDARTVSTPGQWFSKINITTSIRRVHSYFNLTTVDTFYLFHVARRPELKGIEFQFNGTRYKYDEEKHECKIVAPRDARSYFRVGDQYYEFVYVPNKYSQLEKRFHPRMKGTIIDDHGKDIFKHIPKYKAFCNIPDHLNFQEVINNCFNIYSPFEWEPESQPCTDQDCPYILQFIKHIFGESKIAFRHPEKKETYNYVNWELGLDYIQLLLQKPTEKLPIVCLVSKANNTGKSTLGKFLKILFTGNVAIVGNQDLAGDFNSHWASKLLVICDETKIDKQHVIEKVKNLSTADKIMMNAKGKDHVELDCFIKFMFITNNEDSFINISEEDIRYWVIKVPRFTSEITNILELMQDEIPAFLAYLSQRKLLTEKLNRMWFHPSLLKTEALKKVIINSQPTIIKELRQQVKEMFLDFGVDEILMTPTDIKEEFFRSYKYELSYINRVIKEELNVKPLTYWKFDGREYKDQVEALKTCMAKHSISELEAMHQVLPFQKVTRYDYPRWDFDPQDRNKRVRVDVKKNGRPFVFRRADFVAIDEDTVEVPEEFKHVNEMTNNPSSTPALSFPGTPVDDLPF